MKIKKRDFNITQTENEGQIIKVGNETYKIHKPKETSLGIHISIRTLLFGKQFNILPYSTRIHLAKVALFGRIKRFFKKENLDDKGKTTVELDKTKQVYIPGGLATPISKK